jgi:hypothetical protein
MMQGTAAPLVLTMLLSAIIHKASLKIYARGVVSYFYFSRAPRARAENKTNQQCHFKSSRCRMELLNTDSCRETVPMEPPMSNSSMRHQNPVGDFDNTGQILQGALCTIAAAHDLLNLLYCPVWTMVVSTLKFS